jgi:hypothetical protein
MRYRVIDENDILRATHHDLHVAACDTSLFAIELGGRYRLVEARTGRLLAVAEGHRWTWLARESEAA